MKSIIFLGSLFFVMGLQSVYASNASLDDLRNCILNTEGDIPSEKRRKIINECYELARPWGSSNVIEGNALYARILQMYLAGSFDKTSMQALADRLGDYYLARLESKMSSALIESWTDKKLQTVFDGLSAIDFYTSKFHYNDAVLPKFLLTFMELEKRQLANEDQAASIYAALISTGHWDQARSVLNRWPQLSSTLLPFISNSQAIQPGELGYFVLSRDLKTMELHKFDKNHGPKIILSGFCHFAIDAIRELSKLPEISEIMKKHGLVINPNDFANGIDLVEMENLRNEFPNFEFHPVHSSGAWFEQGIQVQMSPSIVFMKDGVARYEQLGYGVYLVPDFCRGLKSIGLSATKACTN